MRVGVRVGVRVGMRFGVRVSPRSVSPRRHFKHLKTCIPTREICGRASACVYRTRCPKNIYRVGIPLHTHTHASAPASHCTLACSLRFRLCTRHSACILDLCLCTRLLACSLHLPATLSCPLAVALQCLLGPMNPCTHVCSVRRCGVIVPLGTISAVASCPRDRVSGSGIRAWLTRCPRHSNLGTCSSA